HFIVQQNGCSTTEAEPVFFCMPQSSKFFAASQLCHNLSHCKSSQIASVTISSPSPKKETFQNFRISPSRSHFYTE
ncbi:hypothetical protein, partial [Escherichia coli]|uniref:hypothetical protein n=3 Tax=Escherichia coli TaxID=562 RepID=UPI001BDBA4AB